MDKTIDNKLLKEALNLYQQRRFEEYDKLEKFTPSKDFEKRMQKLLKSRTNYYHKITLTNLRKAIAAAAVAAILAASAMSVTAIRESIMGFFISRESQVDVIKYKSFKSYPETLEKLYTLTYVPKGYKLEDKTFDEISLEEYYLCGDKYIDFQQFTKSGYSSASDSEFTSPKKVSHSGNDYILRTSDDMVMLVWEKNGYVFEMTGFEKLNEMYKIAESAEIAGE